MALWTQNGLFSPVSVQDLGRRSNDNLISSQEAAVFSFDPLPPNTVLINDNWLKKVTHVWLLFILHFRSFQAHFFFPQGQIEIGKTKHNVFF